MNAIIMAAGMSSRLLPLSWETPKALLEVRGEILIERQIKQLIQANITDITVIVGYMADKFTYLQEKYGISLAVNSDFAKYNNTSTLMSVIDRLSDTWICSSDNYYTENVFMIKPQQSEYFALFSEKKTMEYCLILDTNNNIKDVQIGGQNSWFMIGAAFFSREFSDVFRPILIREYQKEVTKHSYWENVFIEHISVLPPMKVRLYEKKVIYEFDTLDELRMFDNSYIFNTRSLVIQKICKMLNCFEYEITDIQKNDTLERSFYFNYKDIKYLYKDDECIRYL